MKKNEILRRIPKIDEVLKAGGLELLFAGAGRTVVTEAARSVIQDLRNEILKMTPEELEEFDIQRMDIEAVANRVIAYMEQEDCNNLYPVINATGTILHTNLGRAPLCKEAVENVAAVSKGYSNLEYDVEAGKRGSRHNIVSKLICELTGAEDAMLVNNNASATMIVLSAEMFAKIADLIDGIEEIDEGEESITVIPEEEEPEAEDEWVEAEKKATAKKGAVKATVLEADDIDGMLEWLKGELENLEEEADD